MKDELDRARRTLISKGAVLPRSVLAAVGIGAAFGLGMLVGGVGQARGSVPSDGDVLAMARARGELLAHKQGDLKLAFPAELLAPEAKGAPPAVAARSPAAEPRAEQPPTERLQTAKPAAAKPPADPAPVETAPADEPEHGAEPEPPAARETERPSIQATLAKVLGGAPPTAAERMAPPPRTFTLQVASLPQRGPAEALANKLAGQGLNARVVVGEVGGREVFRVRVGAFAERDKAEAAKSKLAMPAFIVSE